MPIGYSAAKWIRQRGTIDACAKPFAKMDLVHRSLDSGYWSFGERSFFDPMGSLVGLLLGGDS